MRTIAELARWWGKYSPDHPATWFEGRTTTWGELDAASTRLAAGLAAGLALRPNDHVAILAKNSHTYLELLFALDKAGAIATPVNWRLRGSEVAKVVVDAEAVAIVAEDEFRGNAEAAGPRVIGLDELPRTAGADPHLDHDLRTCWQLYTSGTTGLPKGVMLNAVNLFGLCSVFGVEMPELRFGGRTLVSMPLYHIGGCGWALAAMFAGSTAVLLKEFDADQVLEIIEKERIETGFLVPAALLFLTSVPAAGDRGHSSLRNILYGASPISQSVLERSIATFGCHFTQVYGLTETTGAVTFLQHEEHKGERLFSCGRATFGAELRVVDPEGQRVPDGGTGEIVYRGVGSMQGYWNKPADTLSTIRDGWLRTGDAGTEDADGFFYIRDRIKDMIISGGENIYPAELESILAANPAVADVAVIGVPDDQWGESVKAIVVLRPGNDLSAEGLIEWSRLRLAGFKRPRSVDFVDALPRNPSGKVLKVELRDPYWKGRARRVN